MARRVYFVFHDGDTWRANVVRNNGLIEGLAAGGFHSESVWEEAKKGDAAIKKMISDALEGTSVTCVLIGEKTAQREYVTYEIEKSIERGNGIFGVRIHNIKDHNQNLGAWGPAPQALINAGAPVYDWEYGKLSEWVEKAYRQVSIFISYSAKDNEFANRLQADLAEKGVRSWLAAQDLKAGDTYRKQINEAIKTSDKMLLVLSRNSVGSDWVRREVEEAFEREKEFNSLVLVPITLDETVMNSDAPWALDIRKARHIGDFQNWRDASKYQTAVERLVRDLRAPQRMDK